MFGARDVVCGRLDADDVEIVQLGRDAREHALGGADTGKERSAGHARERAQSLCHVATAIRRGDVSIVARLHRRLIEMNGVQHDLRFCRLALECAVPRQRLRIVRNAAGNQHDVLRTSDAFELIDKAANCGQYLLNVRARQQQQVARLIVDVLRPSIAAARIDVVHLSTFANANGLVGRRIFPIDDGRGFLKGNTEAPKVHRARLHA